MASAGSRTQGRVAPECPPVAFEQLVLPHWVSMYRLAVHLAGSTDGEDVLQEALAAAWRKRDQFDPARGPAKPWLLAIVADQARKHWRRAKRAAAARADVDEKLMPGSSDAMDVRAVVRRLPERQRLAVGLFYYLDLPVAEVAEVMGCSAGTVKSTLADARRHLEKVLGRDFR